jgi:spermidine synthase
LKNASIVRQTVIFTGVASVVTQLLTIREFLAQFQGNEIVIALLIFNWMILGGIGSLLGRYFTPRGHESGGTRLGFVSMGLVLLAVVQVPAIRIFRDVIFIHGTAVGFYPIWLYSFTMILPYALLLGFALPFSLSVLRLFDPDAGGTLIYILDNIGDIAGGLLFSFALIYLLTPFQAVVAAQVPLLYAALRLFPETRRLPAMIGGILLVMVFALLLYGEASTVTPGEGSLAAYHESRFGRITVSRSEEQVTLFSDGIPLFSNRNTMAAEAAVHYPLSQQPPGGDILLISSVGGMMDELAKHRPRRVDYLELDPVISRIQFRFNLLRSYPWLRVIHMDGRKFLAQTDQRYDAILLSLPEPETYQINRFFTSRFFHLAKQRLKPHGILSFSLDGFDSYLTRTRSRILSSVFNTASEHFHHVQPLPGQKIFFLCSDRAIDLDIPGRLRGKQVPTRYIEGYFFGEITRERIRYLQDSMDPGIPKNRDVSPFLMQVMFQQWFEIFQTSPSLFLVALVVLMIVYILFSGGKAYVLFSTGCLSMSCEILVIFAFQIFFGYVYFKIGIIITVFLAGLLPGAWLAHRHQGRKKTWLTATEILLILSMGILICFFQWGGDRSPECYLLFIAFGISFFSGMQFPIVLSFGGDQQGAVARAFSADLVGAAVGVLLTGLFFIPGFGIIRTAAFLAVLKLTSLMVVQRIHEPLQP